MNTLAIVPARGGSKRIPRKNVKSFLGKPIIGYSIETAIACRLFTEVMVSTDDQEIAEVASKFGASIPFYRSALNSDDDATTADVVVEVIDQYARNGMAFDYACVIYPTAPLLTARTLLEAFNLLVSEHLFAVVPVVKFSYPIWRSLKIEDGRALMNWPEYYNSRSQDLPASYHDAGQFYWIRVKEFLNSRRFFSDKTGVVHLDEKVVQDIDNLADWELAEMKANFFKRD